MAAASLSPPPRWPPPPLGLLPLLVLILACLAAQAPPRAAEAAGVLRQVVAGGGDGDGGTFFEPFNVTYDHRAVILGGKRRMLVSAGLHYPRATPEVSTDTLRFCCVALGGLNRRRGRSGFGNSEGVWLTGFAAAAATGGICSSRNYSPR